MVAKYKRLQFKEFDKVDWEERLWFLAIFQRDIQEAELAATDAIAFAQSGIDDRDPNSMYCRCHDAAVVRYARCFLGCKLPDGSALIRLPDRYLFEGQLKVVHKQVMAFRHGVVAHADLRERPVVLTKHPEGAKPKWTIFVSGGNMPPSGLRMLVGMCRIHRKAVDRELRPLIEQCLTALNHGESIRFAGSVKGDVNWID